MVHSTVSLHITCPSSRPSVDRPYEICWAKIVLYVLSKVLRCYRLQWMLLSCFLLSLRNGLLEWGIAPIVPFNSVVVRISMFIMADSFCQNHKCWMPFLSIYCYMRPNFHRFPNWNFAKLCAKVRLPDWSLVIRFHCPTSISGSGGDVKSVWENGFQCCIGGGQRNRRAKGWCSCAWAIYGWISVSTALSPLAKEKNHDKLRNFWILLRKSKTSRN